MNRPTACPVPNQRGFALVRDAERRDITAFDTGLAQGALHGALDGGANLGGVMLHPGGRWKVLRQLLTFATESSSVNTHDQRRRPRGALID
jgi:hypothetical protein